MQPTTVVAYWPKPARPTRGSTVFFLLPGGEAAVCPVRRRAALAPPCLRAPRLPGRLHTYHAAPSTLSHSPSSSSPPLALSSSFLYSHPSAPVAAARYHRANRALMASPSCQKALSSNSTPSPPRHTAPDALERRHRRHLRPLH